MTLRLTIPHSEVVVRRGKVTQRFLASRRAVKAPFSLMRVSVLLVLLLTAMVRAHLGAHTETAVAITEFTALIALAPQNEELLVRRAMCHEEHGDWGTAENDFRQAVTLAPERRRPVLGLARVLLATARAADALAGLDRLLQRTPGDAEALVLRARGHGLLGHCEHAHADYTTAINALANPRPEHFLARAALPVGKTRALAGIEEGLTRIGPVIGLVERAVELELSLGHVDAALHRIDQLATQAERKESWLRRRGDILSAAGRKAEAQVAYAAAIAAVKSLPSWLHESAEMTRFVAELTELVNPSSDFSS